VRSEEISFAIGREKVGIVGESGFGQIADRRAVPAADAERRRDQPQDTRFRRHRPARRTEPQMRKIRGKRISMILQDPKFSLNR